MVPRLVLLVLLAFGVVAMHTLGHLDGQGSSAAPMAHEAPPHSADLPAGDAPVHHKAGTWVCLAILGMGTIWMLFRLRSIGTLGSASDASPRMRPWTVLLRGPPSSSPMLSVVLRI